MIASVLVFSPFLSSSEIILPNEHVSMVKSAFSWPDSVLLPDRSTIMVTCLIQSR